MKHTTTMLVALTVLIIAPLCLAAADLPAATALSHDAGALLKTLDPFYKQHVVAGSSGEECMPASVPHIGRNITCDIQACALVVSVRDR